MKMSGMTDRLTYVIMLGGIELRVFDFSHYSTPQKAAVVCITFWLLHVDDKVVIGSYNEF